jgi:hypothetical protein
MKKEAVLANLQLLNFLKDIMKLLMKGGAHWTHCWILMRLNVLEKNATPNLMWKEETRAPKFKVTKDWIGVLLGGYANSDYKLKSL